MEVKLSKYNSQEIHLSELNKINMYFFYQQTFHHLNPSREKKIKVRQVEPFTNSLFLTGT